MRRHGGTALKSLGCACSLSPCMQPESRPPACHSAPLTARGRGVQVGEQRQAAPEAGGAVRKVQPVRHQRVEGGSPHVGDGHRQQRQGGAVCREHAAHAARPVGLHHLPPARRALACAALERREQLVAGEQGGEDEQEVDAKPARHAQPACTVGCESLSSATRRRQQHVAMHQGDRQAGRLAKD